MTMNGLPPELEAERQKMLELLYGKCDRCGLSFESFEAFGLGSHDERCAKKLLVLGKTDG